MKYSLSFCHFIYLSFCLLVGCSVLSCPFICLFVYLPQGFIWSSLWRFSAFLHKLGCQLTQKLAELDLLKNILHWGFGAKKAQNWPRIRFFKLHEQILGVFLNFYMKLQQDKAWNPPPPERWGEFYWALGDLKFSSTLALAKWEFKTFHSLWQRTKFV